MAAAVIHSGVPLARTGTAHPMAASGAGSSNSQEPGSASATVSANDFLTLLVTEMKNQDPTAQTDPNEYVNQLVAVNSLQQLIGIHETLTSAVGTSAAGSGDTTASAQAARTTRLPPAQASIPAAGSFGEGGRLAPGNLSVPAANPAAQRIAHALDGQAQGTSIAAASTHR